VINFPNNPIVGDAFNHGGTIYTCVLANPIVWNAAPAGAGIPDAPLDGKTYGRNTAAWKALDKTDVGLGNVDNTADINKPVSNPTITALNGKVAKGGDVMTGPLSIADTGGIESRLVLQSKDTNLSYPIIYGYRGANVRWAIIPGSGVNEAGGNVGGDFTIQRYADNGSYLGTAVSINRASGNVDVYGRLGASGDIATNTSLRGAALSVSGVATAGGRITSTASDVAAIYATAGGIYTEYNSEQAIKANVGGVFANTRFTANSSVGLIVNGSSSDGSTYALAQLIIGNPNWGSLEGRVRHGYGNWAGFEFVAGASGLGQVHLVNSSGATWGSVRAAAFEVQSDATTKRNIKSIPSALAVIDGITAATYEFIPGVRSENDESPIYPKLRYAGSMSQDWQARLPEAVTDSGGGNLMLDYAAIGAVTAQAVSELLQRVKTLEAEILILKGAE
jgi:hypothetical protein